MNNDTFVALCRYYRAEPDGSGNVYVSCPACGRGDRRCSFHLTYGLHCFRCNAKMSLTELADKVLGVGFTPPPSSFSIKPAKPKAWQRMADELVASFVMTPGREAAWRAYKPLPTQLLDLHRLGYGIFPGLYFSEGSESQYGKPAFVAKDHTPFWQCQHKRLIIPLYADKVVVGFRCRSTDCNCPRWLSPSGSKLVLYNGACLLPPDQRDRNLHHLLGDTHSDYIKGKKLVLAENPIDGLWAEWAWGVTSVATLGAGIWKPAWTRLLSENRPQAVLVIFDHDLAGNGGGKHNARLAAEWKAQHNLPAPEPNGMRRARELRKVRVPTRLHDWGEAELGMDLGQLLASGAPLPTFTPQALSGRDPNPNGQVQPLVRFFVTEYLQRPLRDEDFRSSHSAHAKQLLQTYSFDEITAALKALRCGLISADWEVTYLSQLTKGEPSPLVQWRTLAEEGPAVWKTDEYNMWKELTGRVSIANPEGSGGVLLWPPGMRPEDREVGRV